MIYLNKKFKGIIPYFTNQEELSTTNTPDDFYGKQVFEGVKFHFQ